jgi:hypothetical protein
MWTDHDELRQKEADEEWQLHSQCGQTNYGFGCRR